jgi:hypothetical protein
MNKEQLLETLKGLTTALEAANTVSTDNEGLTQSFLAGVRYVLDDLRHKDEEVAVEINCDIDGSSDYLSMNKDVNLGTAYMSKYGGYNDDYGTRCEKYCEAIEPSEIESILSSIGIIPEPTTTEETNPETPNA